MTRRLTAAVCCAALCAAVAATGAAASKRPCPHNFKPPHVSALAR